MRSVGVKIKTRIFYAGESLVVELATKGSENAKGLPRYSGGMD